MSGSVIAVLEDPETTERVVAAAGHLGLSVVLSRLGRQQAEEIPRIEGARLLVVELEDSSEGGLEPCRQARRICNLPLLAMGTRADTRGVVEALRAGSDCYLLKPVDPELLEAQMEVLLRRQSSVPGGPAAVTVRELTVDFVRKEVRLRGDLVSVTPAEYRLLACLAGRLGKVVPSAELLREMSGYDCPEQEAQEIVKVHVSRLRSKIDRDPGQPSYLFNVRGFGYLLERRSTPSR